MDEIPVYRAKIVKYAYFSHWALLLGLCFTLAYQASIFALCLLLTDLVFVLKILSLPPPNCRIYFFFSAEQILHFYLFCHLNLFPCLPPSSPHPCIFLSH